MLAAKGLEVRYGAFSALRGASITVDRGTVVGVVGPNGAGKSTLLKAIVGLSRMTAGDIRIDGEALTGSPPDRLVRGVTLVPQGRRLFNSMSVRENMLMGAYHRRDQRDVQADLDRWVEFFPEIEGKLTAPAGTLSGGQQQIVALMRGLMAAPRYLLLDEPSMGIAPIVVKRIGEVIRRLAHELDLGIILVEQNVRLALAASDEVTVMAQGRDIFHGGPADLEDHDRLAELFFGPQAD